MLKCVSVMFQNVIRWFTMFHDGSGCFKMAECVLQGVYKCCNVVEMLEYHKLLKCGLRC